MDEFVPALIVVDLQEDFCPPNGSLAVKEGREIAAPINRLLELPFALKVATQDWHPANSKTFASQYAGKQPFDTVEFKNPDQPSQAVSTKVWPDHCVQGTTGADLISELDKDKIDKFVLKGVDPDVESYSAFGDIFGRKGLGFANLNLAALLRDHGVTHVYVTGLATDFCVRYTAVDAAKEGFTTYVLWDCARPVDHSSAENTKMALKESGVHIIQSESDDVKRVALLA